MMDEQMQAAEDARTQQVILRLAAMSDKWERVQQAILDELLLAVSQYSSMANPHDGWARIKEELDELWAEVIQEYLPGMNVLLERLWSLWAKYRGEEGVAGGQASND